LIMQQESSRGRSGSVAVDWYYLGRVQTMEEICQKIDSLTCESINSFLDRHQARNFTIVTLGENALEVPVGIS
ncbi:MAG: peptidase M16, partial [Planctomycetaceae bacterium]|nr:peptidase M16 [Planctomycetaceae bacterium]